MTLIRTSMTPGEVKAAWLAASPAQRRAARGEYAAWMSAHDAREEARQRTADAAVVAQHRAALSATQRPVVALSARILGYVPEGSAEREAKALAQRHACRDCAAVPPVVLDGDRWALGFHPHTPTCPRHRKVR